MYVEMKSASPRKKLLGEMNRATTVLRDELNKEFSSIHVDDESLFTDLKVMSRQLHPKKKILSSFIMVRLACLRIVVYTSK